MLKKYSVIIVLLVATVLSYVPVVTANTQFILNTRLAGEFEPSVPYDSKSYQFTLEEDGLITFDVKQIDNNYRLVLFKDGKRIVIVEASDATYQIALKAGTYDLVLSIDQTTNYDFQINFEPGQYADMEPNNSIEEAGTIQENEVVQGLDAVEYPFSEDYYMFEVAKAQQITFKQTDAKLYVMTLDKKILFSQSKAATKETVFNIKPGKYIVVAFGGNYSFSYTLDNVDETRELLPNSNIDIANPLSSGQIVSGQLSGEQLNFDLYKISLENNSSVQLNITGGNPFVEILDATGKKITSNSYRDGYEINLWKGDYFIRLENSQKLDYTLALQTKKVSNVSFEPNDHIRQAQPIPLGQTIGLTSTHAININDYFKVEVPEDGIFKLEKSHRNMSVTLYNAEEQFVDLYKNTLYDEIGLKKGTYYIGVSASKIGQIKATFTKAYVEVEDNDSRLNGQTLHIDETLRGYITHNIDQDVFAIKVLQKDVYHFDVKTIETSFSRPTIIIMQGDNIVYEHNVNDSSMPKVELEAGDYHVVIGGSSKIIYELTWTNKSATAFKDVPQTHRYYKEIAALNKLGVINGYEDATFKPGNSIKRHHAAAMLVRSNAPNIDLGLSYKFFFKDVPRSHPNFENIHKLADAGIVAKSTNGFNPNGNITRAHMAKMIVIAYGLELKGDVQTFKDVANDVWYKEYVDILASHGITTGSDGYFKPNEPLTRQHFALFLYRTLQVK